MDFMRGVWDPHDGFADLVQSVDELLRVEEPGIGKLLVCSGWLGVSAARWRRLFLGQALCSACAGGFGIHGTGSALCSSLPAEGCCTGGSGLLRT